MLFRVSRLTQMKVRFSTEPGDGGACAITVEEQVEDYWSDEHGLGQMFEGLHCKVEPDLDTVNTEAVLGRLLENGVVRDIPRAEGAGMKHLTTRCEKTWRKRNNEWEYKVRFVGREYKRQEFCERPRSFILHWTHCGHSLAQATRANLHSGLRARLSPST